MKTNSHLTRREFKDHIPQVLDVFGRNLLELSASEPLVGATMPEAVEGVAQAAKKHGAHRWRQGYSLEEMTREWGHLTLVVQQEIETFAEKAHGADLDALGSQVQRVWAQTAAEGISASAARFDELTRREAEAKFHALEIALGEARATERGRGEVMRQASHDMRGSLTLIQGATSLLSTVRIDQIGTDELTEMGRIVSSGVSSLTRMISELLELARLEAGQEHREVERFEVGVLMSELGDVMSHVTEENGVTLQVCGPDLTVENDRSKVQRIAHTLLTIALEDKRQGEVTLAWKQPAMTAPHEEHWELTVGDSERESENGTPTPLAAASQAFFNPDAPDGSGESVKFSIVKRLCEILGAQMELETGQRVRVAFPLAYED